jgi:NADH:ubiquinone oxidoreductase subunit 4 (subunit M)
MALTAYCLVSFEHEKAEARSAGVLYFVMSHIGTGCLILGFLVLFQAAGAGSPEDYSFDRFRAVRANLSSGQRDVVFLLFLFGFGVKAGIVPFHIWLPEAHPVAPSNISALLSGVLIKTGIYGMTRVFFDFLGSPPNWWGVTVLTIGTVSALLGVLYALMEHDLKRLLAYHSIENIGIILMGLGASMMFLHTHHPVLASLALIAGLYHTINHAILRGCCSWARALSSMRPIPGTWRRWAASSNACRRQRFSFLVGACRHLRFTPPEWICQRMADLPVVASRIRHHPKPWCVSCFRWLARCSRSQGHWPQRAS